MFVEKTYRIQGNEPLLLNNPKIVWRVVSGQLSIFATKVDRNRAQGDRYYLFDVSQGEVLFGIDPIAKDSPSLLAVALETAQLEELSLEHLFTKIAKKDSEAIELLENWFCHLKEIVPEAIKTTTTVFQENPEQLATSLTSLHNYFCGYLTLLEQEEQKASLGRLQRREKLNRQVAESALGELASILEPKSTTFWSETSPLLSAVGAVGRAKNITIKFPESSQELHLLKDPLEAIARASGFRIRKVRLVDNWWQKEHDCLLAYNREDNSPLALIQQGKEYLLFDPVKNTRIPVSEAVAKTIAPNAYMFYPPLPTVVSNAIELFRFGIKGYEADILKIFAVGSLATILGTIVPIATGISIDRAIPDSDLLLLWQIALALFAAAFGQAAFQLSQGIIALRVENAADGNLQLAVWDRLLKLNPTFFRQYSSGDLVNRVLAVRQIRSRLSGAVQRTLLSSIFSLLNLALMLIYSFQLALAGVGITIASIIFTSICGIFLLRKERQQEKLGGEIYGLTVQLIDGIAKLRVAVAEERAFAVWAEKYAQHTKLTASIKTINDLVSTVNEVLPSIASALLFWMAISSVQTDRGSLTAGIFLAFYAAFGTFIFAVTDLSNTLTDTLGIVPLWERIESIVRSPIESDPERVDPGNLKGRVLLDRISFRYREDGAPILDNVSISANPGEFIAIVGPSGSGKSTLCRLLLGFETPNRGKVYYDGQDLSSLDITAVRRQLGVVLQNSKVQQGSIFENITGGANLSLQEAWEAAEMAGLAEDIREMPMGMHTTVNEAGSNLSGGQRQRLLIARALVNKPKIILMDEATSALDNRTQAKVTESLKQLQATRIAIAHRLSTIREADRIYVIEAGRIVQVGSFAELVMQSGLFARLVARQL